MDFERLISGCPPEEFGMSAMFRLIMLVTFAGFLALMCSCAGGTNSPTLPAIQANLSTANPIKSSGDQGHTLLGVYTLSLGPNGQYTVNEARSEDAHINVTKCLFPPKCLDCFLTELVDQVGELWDFKFTIKNPYNISGFDCRVILIRQGDVVVVNPSSYTKTFALPSDPDPVNPFVIFDSGNGQNQWGPGTQATSAVTLRKPTGSKFTQITLVVDGSFPGNQEDPYMLTEISAKPPSVNIDGSDSTNIAVTVLDWQNNVNFVTVDLSPLGGSKTAELTNVFDNEWLIENVQYQKGKRTRHV